MVKKKTRNLPNEHERDKLLRDGGKEEKTTPKYPSIILRHEPNPPIRSLF